MGLSDEKVTEPSSRTILSTPPPNALPPDTPAPVSAHIPQSLLADPPSTIPLSSYLLLLSLVLHLYSAGSGTDITGEPNK